MIDFNKAINNIQLHLAISRNQPQTPDRDQAIKLAEEALDKCQAEIGEGVYKRMMAYWGAMSAHHRGLGNTELEKYYAVIDEDYSRHG